MADGPLPKKEVIRMPRSTRSTRSAKPKQKLDVMSITVLLVMTIFGGLVGYYVGLSVGSNQMLQTMQATQMMQGQPVMRAR